MKAQPLWVILMMRAHPFNSNGLAKYKDGVPQSWCDFPFICDRTETNLRR